MSRFRPPLIAAWILDRFAAAPETEAIAGDLSEQYQQGRSRPWYWREVMVAILRGTSSEVKQNGLLLLLAITVTFVLNLLWQWFVTPLEYSLLVRYVLGHQARPQEIPLVSLLIVAPLAMVLGWTAARCARRCQIPAVLSIAALGLLSSVWIVWKNAQIVWPESFGYHFSVWTSSWPILPLSVLVLLGGGLLTGSPKRSIREEGDLAGAPEDQN